VHTAVGWFFSEPRGIGLSVQVSGRRPWPSTKRAMMDAMLAVLLLLTLLSQAFGGEHMSYEVQPVRGDGRAKIFRLVFLQHAPFPSGWRHTAQSTPAASLE
jgi:hypothetical protein